MKKYPLYLVLFVFSFGLVACSDEDDAAGNTDGTATVAVRLTDAPGDYEAVYVEVEDVLIKTSPEEGDEGWESIGDVNTGIYDLLSLTGGVTELLAESELPAGPLHQIRLVLGDNNSVVVADEEGNQQELVLETPGAQQSGLKLQVNEELEENTYYTFILDFDVDQSVVTTGNGGYILKPVIRLAIEEDAGSVVGSVHPTTEQVLVTAENANTKASAYTDAEGNFQIHALPAGTYKVTATPPENSGLNEVIVNNVEVEQGASVELDPMFLDGQ